MLCVKDGETTEALPLLKELLSNRQIMRDYEEKTVNADLL
jgi:hypothetical protein